MATEDLAVEAAATVIREAVEAVTAAVLAPAITLVVVVEATA